MKIVNNIRVFQQNSQNLHALFLRKKTNLFMKLFHVIIMEISFGLKLFTPRTTKFSVFQADNEQGKRIFD